MVVKDVPHCATIAGVPGKEVGQRRRKPAEQEFVAYGTPGDIPDPVARALDGLLDQVSALNARVAELERTQADLPPEIAGSSLETPEDTDDAGSASRGTRRRA